MPTNTKFQVLGNAATQEVLKKYFPEDIFTEVTILEALALGEGTILVVNGIVYALNKPSRRKIVTPRHLCERCACENFLRCANVMGPKSNHIEKYDHILEGIEIRSEKAQTLVFDCKWFEEQKVRPANSGDCSELVQLAKALSDELNQSKNYGNKNSGNKIA